MLKIITGLKYTKQIMDVLIELEKHGYRWMWNGLSEGILPTKFIGWKFLVVQHRKMGKTKGLCMAIDEDGKYILDLACYKSPIQEHCEISFSDFLWELKPKIMSFDDKNYIK